jgi:hypothetical protein
MPGKSLNELSFDTTLHAGVTNIISTGYSHSPASCFANESPFAPRLSKSSIRIVVQIKLLLSRLMISFSESRPALKSVPLGQQL